MIPPLLLLGVKNVGQTKFQITKYPTITVYLYCNRDLSPTTRERKKKTESFKSIKVGWGKWTTGDSDCLCFVFEDGIFVTPYRLLADSIDNNRDNNIDWDCKTVCYTCNILLYFLKRKGLEIVFANLLFSGPRSDPVLEICFQSSLSKSRPHCHR